MKNYYEILEVDKNASPEVIDKAYKTLVKKYHPDLQESHQKMEAESKIKEINEAYDILSNELKRAEYNEELQNNYISVERYNLLVNENIRLRKELNNIKNLNNNYSGKYNYYNQNKNSTRDYNSPNENIFYTKNNNNTKSDDSYINNKYKNNNIPHLSEILKKISTLFLNFLLFLFIFFTILNIPLVHIIFKDFTVKEFIIMLVIILLFFYHFKQK